MNNCLEFVTTAGNVELVRLSQYECRGDNALHILKRLVSREPETFEGKRIFASFADSPPDSTAVPDVDLIFCSTKRRGRNSEYVKMPCPYSIGWPQVGIPDGEALVHQLLVYEGNPRFSKIFWIGAGTHPTRRRLCELAIEYPDVLEAELMGWEPQPGKVALRSQARFVSLPDHAAYKYLVDCAGMGYSGRLRWLLATGRPVFIVERPFVEHWHDDLTPWVHYIPVKEDLSDLILAYEEIEVRPWLYEKISRSAKQFVRDHLLLERHLDRMMTKVERFLAKA